MYCMLLEHIASCDFFQCDRDEIEQEILSWDFWIDFSLLWDIVSFCSRLWLIQIETNTMKCQSLTDRLRDLTEKRDRERNRFSVAETPQVVAESPQSKVKESKVNNSIEKEIIENDIIKEETTKTPVGVPVPKKSIVNKNNKADAIALYDKIKEMCTVVDGDLSDCVVLHSKLKLYWWSPPENLWIIIQKMKDTWLSKFYSISSPWKLADNLWTIVEKIKAESAKNKVVSWKWVI